MIRIRLIFGVGFLLGGIVGGFSTYLALKKKNQKILDEKLEELMAYWEAPEKAPAEEKKEPSKQEKKEEDVPVVTTEKIDYQSFFDPSVIPAEAKKVMPTLKGIKIIDYGSFGEKDGYEMETLRMHKDGVLADEEGAEVTDPENVIGRVALAHFLEEDDTETIYVRNEEQHKDYAVVYDDRFYEDTFPGYPKD